MKISICQAFKLHFIDARGAIEENHRFRTMQHAEGKVFAILAALVLDILTFPIRLLTCIPRVTSNAKKEENLFYRYLINEGVEK